MGQKVNPVGMRIGVNKPWSSRWYANKKNYHVFLNEDIKIRDYLTKQLKTKGLSHIDIERRILDDGTSININVYSSRVGAIIGQDSADIKKYTEAVSKLLNGAKVRINVEEVKNPNLDAKLVAQDIARKLENKESFRSAQKSAIRAVRKAGAKGIRTIVSGRLGGADIARSEGYKEGIIPLHTLRSDIDYACAEAATQYGRLGVKVWICRGEIRPELKKDTTKGD